MGKSQISVIAHHNVANLCIGTAGFCGTVYSVANQVRLHIINPIQVYQQIARGGDKPRRCVWRCDIRYGSATDLGGVCAFVARRVGGGENIEIGIPVGQAGVGVTSGGYSSNQRVGSS